MVHEILVSVMQSLSLSAFCEQLTISNIEKPLRSSCLQFRHSTSFIAEVKIYKAPTMRLGSLTDLILIPKNYELGTPSSR